jgi:hypothetical protein
MICFFRRCNSLGYPLSSVKTTRRRPSLWRHGVVHSPGRILLMVSDGKACFARSSCFLDSPSSICSEGFYKLSFAFIASSLCCFMWLLFPGVDSCFVRPVVSWSCKMWYCSCRDYRIPRWCETRLAAAPVCSCCEPRRSNHPGSASPVALEARKPCTHISTCSETARSCQIHCSLFLPVRLRQPHSPPWVCSQLP